MADKQDEGGVSYRDINVDYFEDRQLRRHAGVFYLWALGVAAVISGEFSGWNLGFAVGGWGGMFLGAVLITLMYLGLTYSIAEMSPALPHTGGAYSFARTAFGPWAGYITGVAENVEYVLTPAVIVFFIGAYLTAIFDTPAAYQPIWWVAGYAFFVGLNVRGVELSFTVTTVVTLLAIAVLVIFFVSAIPFIDFGKYALNIGTDPAWSIPSLRPLRGARRDAVRGVAVLGDRAASARRGGIGRPAPRHAQRHHARHVHAHRVGISRPHHQSGDPHHA